MLGYTLIVWWAKLKCPGAWDNLLMRQFTYYIHTGLQCIIDYCLSLTYTDPSEEAVALDDLVSSGANLMNTVDRLLNYINTLNEVTSK